jgi:2-polyprenyl-6-methoxyphenol hydroxylase-like FAD-dependent oxidoreductase
LSEENDLAKMDEKQKDFQVIVIGGSIGGLSAGLTLACKNFDVEIYEKSPGEMKSRGAGLVIQPDMMQYLTEHNISPKEVFGVPATARQYLDEKGQVVMRHANETSFTSWDYIYRQLKDAFPAEKYHFNQRAVEIEQSERKVKVRFENGTTKECDLLVGADGYGSLVRRTYMPESNPIYAGYIAYRGLIEESELDADFASFYAGKFTLYQGANTHILSYFVPGANGELEAGKRRLNWVWYVNKTEAELSKVLLDKDDGQRRWAVPQGFLSDQNATDLRERAVAELPEICARMVLKTREPFVQVIVDLTVPQMVFGRACILGDAAFVVRPHTASGTSKAYNDAISLATSLSYHADGIEAALEHWQYEQIRYARQIVAYGKMLALRSGLGGR